LLRESPRQHVWSMAGDLVLVSLLLELGEEALMLSST
jgi:hypothetical protein